MNFDKRPVIIHVVHSLTGGGTERTLVALLRAFDPSRFRHVVVTLRGAGSLSVGLPDHVACRSMGARGRSLVTGVALGSWTRRWRTAVIHARNTGCWHDATIARLLTPRAKLVLGFHGLETAQPFNRRQRGCARRALRIGARFTSVSESGRRQLRMEAHIPAERITLLRNGVDRHRFQKLDDAARRRMRAGLHLPETAFVVGTVGSLTPVKQHALLIRGLAYIASSLPNVHLLLVGDGPLRVSLSEQARVQGVLDRVCFTGQREDVPSLLACMDAYVCCSASEGMNNSLLEAMAAGLPIVATDVGDNAALVRQGIEGLVVDSSRPEAIGEALRILTSDPAVCRRFAVAALARASDYDFDDTVRAYETYYQQLIADVERVAVS